MAPRAGTGMQSPQAKPLNEKSKDELLADLRQDRTRLSGGDAGRGSSNRGVTPWPLHRREPRRRSDPDRPGYRADHPVQHRHARRRCAGAAARTPVGRDVRTQRRLPPRSSPPRRAEHPRRRCATRPSSRRKATSTCRRRHVAGTNQFVYTGFADLTARGRTAGGRPARDREDAVRHLLVHRQADRQDHGDHRPRRDLQPVRPVRQGRPRSWRGTPSTTSRRPSPR